MQPLQAVTMTKVRGFVASFAKAGKKFCRKNTIIDTAFVDKALRRHQSTSS
jgi:hypothetical protein